jgi:uncharacterized protein (TIGR01244 family)
MFTSLTPEIAVAPQIAIDDCARAGAAGFVTIICNRPDGEDAGQTAVAAMAAASGAAGLRFVHIPVDAAGIDDRQIALMAAELGHGPVLAYCRSGTRSTHLWALAAASRGGDVDAIIAAAAGGGYDVSAMRTWLFSLAGKA